MNVFFWLLFTTVATNDSSPPIPAWDRVFDATSHGWVSTLAATGRETWIAGGPWGLATTNGAGTHVESTHGHGVLGLFVESPHSAYAFGEGELIWHFDGKKWTEEHVGPLPPRAKRRPFADHMLYLSYYGGVPADGPLVAFGLSLVLVKQPDGTWARPPDADKKKVLEIGQLGPQVSRPAKCAPAGWHWFGRNRGALYCHDRRMFIVDTGRLTPKGKLPSNCYDGLNSLVELKGELYASCRALTLWRTEGEAWHRIDPPKEKGLKEIPSISVADGCLFVGGNKSVWRRCGE